MSARYSVLVKTKTEYGWGWREYSSSNKLEMAQKRFYELGIDGKKVIIMDNRTDRVIDRTG